MTISKTKQQLLDFIATKIFPNGGKQVTAQMNQDAVKEIVNATFPVGVDYSKIETAANIVSQITEGWYAGTVPVDGDGYYFLNAESKDNANGYGTTHPYNSVMARVNGVKVWQTPSVYYDKTKLILSLVIPLRAGDVIVIQTDANKELSYATCKRVL